MAHSPPDGKPQCCPVLFCQDVAGEMAFLCQAFGFDERFVARDADGAIEHAQLGYRGALVMLGPSRSPRALRPCATPRETGVLHGAVYLYVDDVDQHAARARQAGAEIVAEPADLPYGERVYCALDREGHFWAFAAPLSPSPQPR